MKDAVRSMAGLRPRPDFLHEFVPEGHVQNDIVEEKEECIDEEENSNKSAVLELPEKMDKFLEVKWFSN